MEEKNEPPKMPIVDDPHAPEIFVSEVVGTWLNSDVVRIAFASARGDHSSPRGQINRVVNLRLAMPVPAAKSLAAELFSYLKQQGHDPVPAPPKGEMQ